MAHAKPHTPCAKAVQPGPQQRRRLHIGRKDPTRSPYKRLYAQPGPSHAPPGVKACSHRAISGLREPYRLANRSAGSECVGSGLLCQPAGTLRPTEAITSNTSTWNPSWDKTSAAIKPADHPHIHTACHRVTNFPSEVNKAERTVASGWAASTAPHSGASGHHHFLALRAAPADL